MIKVGDKVKFLNDVGGGTVTRIVGKNLVHVENEDGFEIPTLVSQLVKIEDGSESYEPSVRKQSEKVEEKPVEIVENKGEYIKGKDRPEFYLALVPQIENNPVGGDIEAWLVNDSNFILIAHYSQLMKGTYKSIWHGDVKPNSKKHLEDFNQIDFTEFPVLCFQVIYFAEESKELTRSVIKELKINPVKFYKEKSFSKNLFFDKNAMLLSITNKIQEIELDKLTDSDIEKIIFQKEEVVSNHKQTQERIRTDDLVEVDLHVNEILDNTTDLSNHEILEIQMDKFRSEMEQAIKNRIKRIVFIHGVGQGTLKSEIVNELKTKYRKYYFQDASFKEYGYGATMVILRKS